MKKYGFFIFAILFLQQISKSCDICNSSEIEVVDNVNSSSATELLHDLDEHYKFIDNLIQCKDFTKAYEETVKIIELNNNEVNNKILTILLSLIPLSNEFLKEHCFSELIELALSGNKFAEAFLKKNYNIKIKAKK